jgi:hypothetical protein
MLSIIIKKKKKWSDKLITSHQPNEYSNLFYRDIVLHVQAVNSCPETAKVRRFVGVIYASVCLVVVCLFFTGRERPGSVVLDRKFGFIT